MCFCVFFSIYVMFLLYVYMFTICSCHVVLKVYLLTCLYLLRWVNLMDVGEFSGRILHLG